MADDYDYWKEFYESDGKWPWCNVPLYYLHILLAVAYGDARVGFQGDKIPEGMTPEDYPLTGGPIPDLWFQWARPPEKRKFAYPEIADDPKEQAISDLPSKTSQRENWDSEDYP